MNISIKISSILIIFLLFLFYSTCEKPEREPKVETGQVTEIKATSANVSGEIIDLGEGISEYGHCWSTQSNPTIDAEKTSFSNEVSTGNYTSQLTDLQVGVKYFVKAWVRSGHEVVYGKEVNFTTLNGKAILITSEITDIKIHSATSGGNITDDGGYSITSRGVCWNKTGNPTLENMDGFTTDGIGIGSFASNIQDLQLNTTYYLRAYATNSAGTWYGEQFICKTATGIITDFDGNIYYTVTIGTQLWMKENLKTTRYNDGTGIPFVTDNSEWGNLTTAGYCWYNNDPGVYKDTYGALYNGYAVSTGKLCPSGWHVPTDAQLTALTDCLGGASVAGRSMKEAGTTHWISPYTWADNSSGFTALPGGLREYYSGSFVYVGYIAWYWSSTEENSNVAWYRSMNGSYSEVFRNEKNKQFGLSVRCIKD
jgi:uncharacterized protein (TIGR02145 family)